MRTSFDDRLEEILLEYTDANELWCNAVEEKEEDPHEIKRQEDRQQCAKQDLEQFGRMVLECGGSQLLQITFLNVIGGNDYPPGVVRLMTRVCDEAWLDLEFKPAAP